MNVILSGGSRNVRCSVKFVYPSNLSCGRNERSFESRFKKRKRKNIMIGCAGCIFNKKFRIGVLQTANTIIFRQQTDLIFKVYKSHL